MQLRPNDFEKTAWQLRQEVLDSLGDQGFSVENNRLFFPDSSTKEDIRRLHSTAIFHLREKARPKLFRFEPKLLSHIANGSEVIPQNIQPSLTIVQPGSQEELLFRYLRLHWSIPVSAGYGRRLRFIVRDKSNDKAIGILGLGDPVFSLGARDSWIGWTQAQKKTRLRSVMDAFVLGAIPPYSDLLFGKFLAMLLASDEIRHSFADKYGGRTSYITGASSDGHLALITTTSALGRSSVYNRVRYENKGLLQSVGYTKGSGDFHFSNELYLRLRDFAEKYCLATAKHESWGTGFRNRRELLRKVLPKLGFSRDLVYHGVRREIFVVPLAENSREFLCGSDNDLRWHTNSLDDLFTHFRHRWLLPRAARTERYKSFEAKSFTIWTQPYPDEERL